MKKVILKIDGMSCSGCQNRVEKYLNNQDGVSASVNLVMAQALIEYDEDKVTLSDLDRFVSESGYKSLGVYNDLEENKKDSTKKYLIIFAFLILFIMYISMSHMINIPIIPFLDIYKYPINYGITLLVLTLLFIIFGFDIIISGIKKLIHKSPNMDTLVTIGVLSSFTYSLINLVLIILGNNNLVNHLYFESCSMIIYFIKLGRCTDKNSKEKTKEAIKELVCITPKNALIKTDNGEKEITIDEVNINDILICKPGMKIAVDGTIASGSAHFDEAFITGESIPSKKHEKDKVLAGTINLDGYIEYKAEKIGPNSTISEIVRLVIEATNTKAQISKIADIISSYFAPSIIGISIITFIIYLILGNSFNDSIVAFVTILVVACPCALGLATPLAMVVSNGHCAKKGILVKNNEILENTKNIDTIVFDKTGTLTYGNLKISVINNYSNYKDEELLSIISSIENNSTHPISKAFKEYYNSKIKVDNFVNLSGLGICGDINGSKIYIGNNKLLKNLDITNEYEKDELSLLEKGNSVIYVIENKKIISIMGIKDIVRDNAKETISKLKKMNKEIILLSGDNEIITKKVGKELDIDNIISNVLPTEKQNVLKKLIDNNHKVMMVGDGINDALALATSDVGVTIKSATDIAGDSSDVILIYDDLSKIVDLFNTSKKTIRIIKQNLFWAFIYNVIMIPIAVGLFKPLGIMISPMIASISMILSSLIVVFNSLRLKK